MEKAGNIFYMRLLREVYYPIHNFQVNFWTEDAFDAVYTNTTVK